VEPVEGAVELGPAPGWSALVRPTIFSIAFGGGTVCACAVWQYENMRLQAARGRVQDWWTGMEWGVKKAGGWREELHQWWSKQHEGEKLFWPICFLNVLVFAAWKVPALQGTMLKYFASNPGAKAACLPMLLSAFSHFSAFHLGANMFVLHSFMTPAVELLGKEQFLAIYMSSAVFTSLASYVHKVATARVGFSLGASGAICTVLGLFGTLVPHAQMQILFLPMFTFSAATAIKGLMVIDGTGLVMGWRFFDHAAHFSGVLYGVFWCYFGQKLIWENREPLVTRWHKFRTSTD